MNQSILRSALQSSRVWYIARPLPLRSNARFSTGVKQDIIVERLTGDDEGVVVMTMDRPEAKNALGRNMIMQFRDAIEDIQFDPSARVVILRSNVPRVFCAGADLKERLKMTQAEAASAVFRFRKVFTDLASMNIPSIAAIEGAALGGGLEMALACDFRISGAKAILGVPETSLAIIPGAGGTQRLPRLIGKSKAKELIFTAARVSSAESEKIGLVDYAVEEGKAYERALQLARDILPQGPIAIRMAKEAVESGMEMDIANGMNVERYCYAQVIPTKDRIEGLQAFREKRKPHYKGE